MNGRGLARILVMHAPVRLHPFISKPKFPMDNDTHVKIIRNGKEFIIEKKAYKRLVQMGCLEFFLNEIVQK